MNANKTAAVVFCCRQFVTIGSRREVEENRETGRQRERESDSERETLRQRGSETQTKPKSHERASLTDAGY